MKSRLRKVNERKEKENFSLDKAIKYIKENDNNFKVLVEPEKVVNMAVQNPNMPDIYIDGKPYMYGGKNFQEADIKRKQIVQERNKGINYN